ncbi:hypothetical protein EDB19DRAFT_1912490 [Suillus lakei]|nr:hypothetical protein EDB19DRAFT_1912490 [Suillus lakei]
MPGILEGHYVKLEEKSLHITFVSIHDLTLYPQSSAQRVFKSLRSAYPQAYTYRSINIDSGRDWKSAIKVLSSDESVAWGDTVTLSSHESHQISLDVRASFELDRMLDSGEVIGKLQTSWDEPLDHGEEPFGCKIAQDTDAGHAQFSEYTTSKTVSHLNDAVQHFQLVLNQCPFGHPDRAAALTNLAYARLQGYICNDIQDIDSTTSLCREAL